MFLLVIDIQLCDFPCETTTKVKVVLLKSQHYTTEQPRPTLFIFSLARVTCWEYFWTRHGNKFVKIVSFGYQLYLQGSVQVYICEKRYSIINVRHDSQFTRTVLYDIWVCLLYCKIYLFMYRTTEGSISKWMSACNTSVQSDAPKRLTTSELFICVEVD